MAEALADRGWQRLLNCAATEHNHAIEALSASCGCPTCRLSCRNGCVSRRFVPSTVPITWLLVGKRIRKSCFSAQFLYVLFCGGRINESLPDPIKRSERGERCCGRRWPGAQCTSDLLAGHEQIEKSGRMLAWRYGGGFIQRLFIGDQKRILRYGRGSTPYLGHGLFHVRVLHNSPKKGA